MNLDAPSSSPSVSSLASVFKDAEARHWTDQEVEQLISLDTSFSARADVARSCWRVEAVVVDETVDAIFDAYPYREHHQLSTDKCARDITNVSTYAIHSMLLDDINWYRNKLLLWLKTILQSFDFPARSRAKEVLMFGDSTSTDIINGLPPGRQSIYETYYLLQENYKKHLEASEFEVFEPHVSIIKDILSGE